MAQLELLAAQGDAPRLVNADPSAWRVAEGWSPLVQSFWTSADGLRLATFLRQRSEAQAVIFPPSPLKALSFAGPDAVRVVILGQDPYHGPGQAEGLAFSVAPGMKIPPSLRNIHQELQRDLGLAPPANGSLLSWAQQGVLLLNTVLTVEEGLPASHAGQGWEALTDGVIRQCAEAGPAKVFLLWGNHAQKKASLIDAQRHLVLCANHPSPLSARRGPVPFIGCGHFGQVNSWLAGQGFAEIRW